MAKHAVIVGAGIAGLSAAIRLAEGGWTADVICNGSLGTAQSVMAEGGINAVLEDSAQDSAPEHAADTLASSKGLAVEADVERMTGSAAGIVKMLEASGAVFDGREGKLSQRSFGGQSKQRSIFCGNETGKQIMAALCKQVHRYEAKGLIRIAQHRSFGSLMLDPDKQQCCGVVAMDAYTMQEERYLADAVIMACGGTGGMFPQITGSLLNIGSAQCELFRLGVEFANLEFIQYHPTAMIHNGKAHLVSEAVRAEGGRLMAYRDGEPWYFMEELSPAGNLAPRDITAREIHRVMQEQPVFLDCRGISEQVMEERLGDFLATMRRFVGLDPLEQPIPVAPAIHYFMGGIAVDSGHRASMKGLYAAGECDQKYHGANRLGGNSLLGGIFGGQTAAESVMEDGLIAPEGEAFISPGWQENIMAHIGPNEAPMKAALAQGLGIVRDAESIHAALGALAALPQTPRVIFAQAMLGSALAREESRGAHYRSDFPESSEAFDALSIVRLGEDGIQLRFAPVQMEAR